MKIRGEANEVSCLAISNAETVKLLSKILTQGRNMKEESNSGCSVKCGL